MKHYILCLFLLLQLSSIAYGDETVSLSFSKDQYSFVRDALGRTEILSLKQTATYGSDELQPGLPLLPLNVALPSRGLYKGIKVSIQKKELIIKDVDIAPNPKAVITGSSVNSQALSPVKYNGNVFPDSNVEYVGSSEIRDVGIARFLICPFIYDSSKRELYLIEKLELNIETERTSSPSKVNIPFDEKSLNMLRAQVCNGSALPSASVEEYAMPTPNEPIKYLIVTNMNLANDFQGLADWKKTKGINSKVVTVEEIEQTGNGKTLQEKIKHFIYDTYVSDGLQYVLLGGDDTVVPVQYSYCDYFKDAVNSYYIPSDAYYSCFGENFEWDANGNRLYGEPDDGIDFTQNVYLARVPVRTPWEAYIFSDRVLDYEQDPMRTGWKNKMLSMGYKLDTDNDNSDDAEKKGEYIYDHYIKGNWNGKWSKFYNSGTNLPVEGNYEFVSQNIQEQLSKGYAFVDVIAHGSPIAWGTGDVNSYTTDEASELYNSGYSFITTNSCHTNAFDQANALQTDPCLSESLIRNENSGVVAYWGCSREGWDNSWDIPGCSTQYTGQFYKNLFSPECTDKNYGYISALAKGYFINSCKYDGTYRWVQLGLNAIGDPEMPIYTEEPKEFSDAYVKYTGIGKVSVNTGTDGATVCISSNKDTEPYYKVIRDIRNIEFSNLPKEVTICITKQNYIPKVYNLKNTYIQNKNVSNLTVIASDGIFIGSDVTNTTSGPVEFSAPAVRLTGKEIIMTPDITFDKECDIKITNTK